ncbi:MAG: tRNA (adenosine(37)-N6)-threonylcarbamoyltransferase complex ATPase subunit type 1 TsaE [Myxococcales bacterium]|nr:tRNA (adenosine(37)-N6)-threonylcarbamoyltransferase complex ATPase subunit type 1 TsaE [Myxococcales bacterium]MCB9524319.1 tRNA (adenosine(37)-N6)-threonylcarbamoyltransferase complex ATPase subunit type 1 TsaE [Myxococcales bacterium]
MIGATEGWLLTDAEATRAAGAALGRLVPAGLVLLAEGDLGAGKTTFAQGLARGLGVPPEHYVNSPTFAILQTHPGRVPFHHIDLYRLGDPDEIWALGLDDVLEGDGVSFVEWPERWPELAEGPHLRVHLADGPGGGRRLEITAQGAVAEGVRQAFIAAHGS